MHVNKALSYAYNRLIIHPAKQVPFWILVGFLPTFLIARLIVDNSSNLYLSVDGTHVHHFTYGIIVLAVTGFISLVWPDVPRRVLAAVYGIGLALAFDEFGMWLHLNTNYDIHTSVYVMVGILTFLLFTVYGMGIVQKTWRSIRR